MLDWFQLNSFSSKYLDNFFCIPCHPQSPLFSNSLSEPVIATQVLINQIGCHDFMPLKSMLIYFLSFLLTPATQPAKPTMSDPRRNKVPGWWLIVPSSFSFLNICYCHCIYDAADILFRLSQYQQLSCSVFKPVHVVFFATGINPATEQWNDTWLVMRLISFAQQWWPDMAEQRGTGDSSVC